MHKGMKLNVTVRHAVQTIFDEGQEVRERTRSFTIIDSDERCNEKHEARYRNKYSGNGILPIRVKIC